MTLLFYYCHMKKNLTVFIILFPIILSWLAMNMGVNGSSDQADILLTSPVFFVLHAILIAPFIEEFAFRYSLQSQRKSNGFIRYASYFLQLIYILVLKFSPFGFSIACVLIISYILFERKHKWGFPVLIISTSIAFIILHVNMNAPYEQTLKLLFVYTVMTVVFVLARIKLGFTQGIATHMWYNLVQCVLVLGFVSPRDQSSKSYTLKSEIFGLGSQTFQSEDSLYFKNVNFVEILESLSSSKLIYASEFATINNWTGNIHSKEQFVKDFASQNDIMLDTCTVTFTRYSVQEPKRPNRSPTLFYPTWIEGKVDASSTMRNLLNTTNLEKRYAIEWIVDVVWSDSAIYFNSNQISTLDFMQLKKAVGFEVIDSLSYPVDLVILRHPISRWFRSTHSMCGQAE